MIISVTVSNTGETGRIYEAIFKINDKVSDTKETNLVGGTNGNVTFSAAGDKAGRYAVYVNCPTGSFVVKEEAPPVLEPTANTEEPLPLEEETSVPTKSSSTNWWIIVGSTGGLVIITAITFYLFKRRKQITH